MDDIPLFNSESFIANKSNPHKIFFEDFCSTQIFRQFLQNDSKENFPYFYKIENQKKNAIYSNNRQSCYMPRTSVLDVSKFIHIRANSNNFLLQKAQAELPINNNVQSLVGIKISDNINEKNKDKKEKEKSKSEIFFLNFFIFNLIF